MQSEGTERARSTSGHDKRTDPAAPGLLPAAGIAVLAGLGMWALLSHGVGAAPSSAAGAGPFDIANVDKAEMTGALGSMAGSNADLSRLTTRREACPPRLAWVSLVLAPNQPRTSVRLQSGRFASAALPVTEVPQRVAIPYPGPYELGHGTLIVRKSGGAVDVALVPAWHVAASETEAAQEVSWRPVATCAPHTGGP